MHIVMSVTFPFAFSHLRIKYSSGPGHRVCRKIKANQRSKLKMQYTMLFVFFLFIKAIDYNIIKRH